MTWHHGDPIPGTRCPTCGQPITYNGNYFCIDWTYPFTGTPGTCDWAMTAETELMTKKEKHLFNVAYTQLMLLRGEKPKADVILTKSNGEPW